MGYGVIGSPTGSGPVSLGSSPGTPALSWITVLNGPSGPFSRLARAAAFGGTTPRAPRAALRPASGARRRPSSRRAPRPLARRGARRWPSSRRGWFLFLRFNFLSPRGQPDPCPHAPASPRLRVLRSVRAAVRVRRPGSSPVPPAPCAHDLGPTGAVAGIIPARAPVGGRSPTPVAAPAQPTPRDPAGPPAQASGWAVAVARLGAATHRSSAANPRDSAAVSPVGAKKIPVREGGFANGDARVGEPGMVRPWTLP
jgi:hypothetical protein